MITLYFDNLEIDSIEDFKVLLSDNYRLARYRSIIAEKVRCGIIVDWLKQEGDIEWADRLSSQLKVFKENGQTVNDSDALYFLTGVKSANLCNELLIKHFAFISSWGFYNQYESDIRKVGEPDIRLIKDDGTELLAIDTIVSANISETDIRYRDANGLKTVISYDGVIEHVQGDVNDNTYHTQYTSDGITIVGNDGRNLCVIPQGIYVLCITSSGIIITYKRDITHSLCAFGLMNLKGEVLVECKYAFDYYGENKQFWGGYPYEVQPCFFDMRGPGITNFDEICESTGGYVAPVFDKTNLRYFDAITRKWYVSQDTAMEDSFDSLFMNCPPSDDGLYFEDAKCLADGFYCFPQYFMTNKNKIFSQKYGLLPLEPNERVLTKLVSSIDEHGAANLQETAFISEGKIITELLSENSYGVKSLRIRDYKGNIIAKLPGYIKDSLERPFQYGKLLITLSSSLFFITEDGERHSINFENMDFPAFYHEQIDQFFGDFGAELISPEVVWVRQKSAQYLVNINGTVLNGGKDVVFLRMSKDFVCVGVCQNHESGLYKFGVCDMTGKIIIPTGYVYPFLPNIIVL